MFVLVVLLHQRRRMVGRSRGGSSTTRPVTSTKVCASEDGSIAPEHRCTASLTGITAVAQGTATAKPKKPNIRQTAAPSTVSAPASCC
jgi:hypothetical protein